MLPGVALKEPSAFTITLPHGVPVAAAEGTAVSAKPLGFVTSDSRPGAAICARDATTLVKLPGPACGAAPAHWVLVEQSVIVAICATELLTLNVKLPPHDVAVEGWVYVNVPFEYTVTLAALSVSPDAGARATPLAPATPASRPLPGSDTFRLEPATQ